MGLGVRLQLRSIRIMTSYAKSPDSVPTRRMYACVAACVACIIAVSLVEHRYPAPYAEVFARGQVRADPQSHEVFLISDFGHSQHAVFRQPTIRDCVLGSVELISKRERDRWWLSIPFRQTTETAIVSREYPASWARDCVGLGLWSEAEVAKLVHLAYSKHPRWPQDFQFQGHSTSQVSIEWIWRNFVILGARVTLIPSLVLIVSLCLRRIYWYRRRQRRLRHRRCPECGYPLVELASCGGLKSGCPECGFGMHSDESS